MNERVMQFRIGMFVIVAGLVLTMLIVWFGESPTLFRDHGYVVVRYDEAPGVAEGIAVRKSGIRVGEVTAVAFDDRPDQRDGVLVTISLERKYQFKAGTVNFEFTKNWKFTNPWSMWSTWVLNVDMSPRFARSDGHSPSGSPAVA